MQRYLNKHDQDDLITIVAMGVGFEDIIDKWEKVEKPEDVIAPLKESRTQIGKILDYFQKTLDPEEQKRLLRKAKQYLVVLRPTMQAKREYREMIEMEDRTVMLTEDFYDILEELMPLICNKCQKSEAEEADCNLRRILMLYNVPSFDLETKGCTYKSCIEYEQAKSKAESVKKYVVGEQIKWKNVIGDTMTGVVMAERKNGYRVKVGPASQMTVKFKQIIEEG